MSGPPVYLTGAHIWNNLHDGMGPGPDGPAGPERIDYDAHLRFLSERGHNFIRLWRWKQVRSQAAGEVVISDTDHYAPGQGDALWTWKSFLRGHHPILMDFGLIAGLEPAAERPAETGVPPFAYYEPARWTMGDTRRYAERVGQAAGATTTVLPGRVPAAA